MFKFKTIIILLIFNLIFQCFSTISKSDKKKKTSILVKENDFAIFDDVNFDLKKDIVDKSSLYSNELKDRKLFSVGSTLGYVTPWNNYGYDIAKTFTHKFSFISPVWLGISYDGQNFEMSGSRNIDLKWIMDLKSKNPQLKVVPRLLFENWSPTLFMNVVHSEYIISKCIDTITKFLLKYNLDGVVLEMWLQVGVHSRQDSIHFLQHFGQDMKSKNLLFILPIPPPVYSGNHEGYFSNQDFVELSNSVNFFSLMTYDYSNSQSPGPNAPLDWMKRCVQILEPKNNTYLRSKILMGLNFYGYLYSNLENKAVVRHEFIDLLKNVHNVETIWHKDVKEHEFRIKYPDGSTGFLWYPTVESVKLRVQLAEKLGVGISIWEIGQGLDYFYNVL